MHAYAWPDAMWYWYMHMHRWLYKGIDIIWTCRHMVYMCHICNVQFLIKFNWVGTSLHDTCICWHILQHVQDALMYICIHDCIVGWCMFIHAYTVHGICILLATCITHVINALLAARHLGELITIVHVYIHMKCMDSTMTYIMHAWNWCAWHPCWGAKEYACQCHIPAWRTIYVPRPTLRLGILYMVGNSYDGQLLRISHMPSTFRHRWCMTVHAQQEIPARKPMSILIACITWQERLATIQYSAQFSMQECGIDMHTL